jgi:poly(A) polymerase
MTVIAIPPWLASDRMARIFRQVEAEGGQLKLVGGVVRDLIRGETGEGWPADIDAASSLPPQTMMKIGHDLGIKVVPTGLAHGTVTFVMPEAKMEITTLRRDVATDGRHAEVAYTDNFEQDAQRRDFTMNALYLAQDGTITDYHHGIADAKAGRVHFIGDAKQRITEDALRILRYFRFLATHGSGPAEQAALDACAQQQAMLQDLSGERIQQEMRKLLAAKNPCPAIDIMARLGILETIFQQPCHTGGVTRLVHLERAFAAAIHPWLRLSVLLANHNKEALAMVLMRLRVSNEVKNLLTLLASSPPLTEQDDAATHKKYIRQYGASYFRLLLLRSAALADTAWNIKSAFDAAAHWQPPEFPLKGGDLISYGVPKGKEVGAQLKKLEEIWEENDYALDKDALIKQLKEGKHRGR